MSKAPAGYGRSGGQTGSYWHMNRDGPLHERHSFIIDSTSALGARSWATSVLASWGIDAPSDPVVLITAELVTNAIRYGVGPIDVDISFDRSGFRVGVSDRSDGKVEKRVEVPVHAASGRGLRIIEALSDEWGVEPLPGGGKTVWARVSVEPSPAPLQFHGDDGP